MQQRGVIQFSIATIVSSTLLAASVATMLLVALPVQANTTDLLTEALEADSLYHIPYPGTVSSAVAGATVAAPESALHTDGAKDPDVVPTSASKLDSLVIDLESRDYNAIARDAFAGRAVPEDAVSFLQTVDEYRGRIALQIQQTNNLLLAINTVLAQHPDHSSEIDDKLSAMKLHFHNVKSEVMGVLTDDDFLRRALIGKYDLYGSFFQKIFGRTLLKNQIIALRRVKDEMAFLRGALEELYQSAQG